ncbi:MAG: CPBP family intramembrane metalloprotease [Bacteroidales bacterium]|nr:CPBP family intramembrane metalloprotease [Candidatus Cacconaster merdequi]
MKRLDSYLPNLGQCWLLVILMLVGSLFAGFVFRSGPQSAAYLVSMAFPLLYGVFLSRKSQESLPLNAPSFGRMGAVATFSLCGTAMLCLMVLMEPTTHYIPMPDLIKNLFEQVFLNTPLWDSILSTCILAPLLEETLCRGVMVRGLMKHGSEGYAIFWSAFLFALMHANPWQSIPAFLIGAFFGWIYCRTRCLWLTIFLHCLNNSVSTIVSRLTPQMEIDQDLMDLMGGSYWVLFAGCLCVFSIIIYLLNEKTVSSEIRPDAH